MRFSKEKRTNSVRLDIFSMRVNAEERRLITRLAELLQRSQSDAVRFVVVSAAKEMEHLESTREISGANPQAEIADNSKPNNSTTTSNDDEDYRAR